MTLKSLAHVRAFSEVEYCAFVVIADLSSNIEMRFQENQECQGVCVKY
jgi:hypothetical protein